MAAGIHQSLEWFSDFLCLFAHVRAYAIRPYTCSVIVVAEYGEYLHLFDDCWGGMGLIHNV